MAHPADRLDEGKTHKSVALDHKSRPEVVPTLATHSTGLNTSRCGSSEVLNSKQ